MSPSSPWSAWSSVGGTPPGPLASPLSPPKYCLRTVAPTEPPPYTSSHRPAPLVPSSPTPSWSSPTASPLSLGSDTLPDNHCCYRWSPTQGKGRHLTVADPLHLSVTIYYLHSVPLCTVSSGTSRKWNSERVIIFSRLSCNTSDSSLAPKIFARKLRPDSPPVIVDRITNLYSTPTPRLQRIWGGLAGHKIRSNIIVNFRTLFYAENCMRQSDFFADCRQGGGDSTQKTDIGKNGCYGWNRRICPGGKTPVQKNPPCSMLEL